MDYFEYVLDLWKIKISSVSLLIIKQKYKIKIVYNLLKLLLLIKYSQFSVISQRAMNENDSNSFTNIRLLLLRHFTKLLQK